MTKHKHHRHKEDKLKVKWWIWLTIAVSAILGVIFAIFVTRWIMMKRKSKKRAQQEAAEIRSRYHS